MDAILHLAENLMDSPWLYLLVLALAAVDGFFPIVPAETVVIAAGAYAVTGQPLVLGLLIAAWAGALLGDVLSHHLGRGAGPIARWFRRRRWGGRLLGWAERELRARGGMLLISARFIPGGRTATTLTSGIVGYPRRRFVGFAAIAGLLWSLYSVGIGMVGGLVFQAQPLLGVAVGIGLALAVGGGIELVRAWRRRSNSEISPPPDRLPSSRSQARSSSISPPPDRPPSSRSQARSSSISPRSSAERAACPAPGRAAP